MAAWSNPKESSHEIDVGPSWAEISVGLLASTRSSMEGCESLLFQVGVEGGLMHKSPLSPIQSVKALPYDKGVCPVSDQRWE
jgi:hypothetical protein